MRVQPSQSIRGSGRAPWIALQAFVIRAAPLSHRSNIAVAMTATVTIEGFDGDTATLTDIQLGAVQMGVQAANDQAKKSAA